MGKQRKLTEEQVRKIRVLAAEMPQRRIAERFAVSAQLVNDILKGRKWKGVQL